MRAGLLWVGRKERNVKKIEAALIDCERNDGLTLKLTETSQVFIAVEQDELFDGKLSVAQDRLDLAPFECRGTNDSNTQGVRFSGTHEVERDYFVSSGLGKNWSAGKMTSFLCFTIWTIFIKIPDVA